ncbi:MAG TPA: hypothetical protein VMM12_05905 [Longimicrobiales bacterium]|nr:hypothetical protein [Longimicrobiales bacterium]
MTTVLERFDVLQRLSGQHNYSPAMTPVQFADCYLHLAVPVAESRIVFIRIQQYRMGLPPAARVEKDRLLGALRREWARGNLLSIRPWASKSNGGEGRIMRSFNGKALPEEMILTCQLAVITSIQAEDRVDRWASTHFGLDCSGFVNNYFVATGRLREHRTILAHAGPESRRIRRVEDIHPLSLLIWADQAGRVKSGPGHIAIVDHWIDRRSRRLMVVESSGSLSGLHTGLYEILADPAETRRTALWRVRRPNGQQAHVYFLPPPEA